VVDRTAYILKPALDSVVKRKRFPIVSTEYSPLR